MSDFSYRLSKDIADLVEADGIPREADDLNDSGTRHMLYRDGEIVHSCLIEEWASVEADLAIKEQARQKREQMRADLRSALAPLKGKRPPQWGIADLRALLAVLLSMTVVMVF